MKKMILFTGGVETLDYFSLQLAKAFRKFGHEVFIFDFLKEVSYRELLSFLEEKNTVMISFNFSGIREDEEFLDEAGKLFWNTHRIPCYNIVVDHPFYYHDLIRRRPEHYLQISIDRDHKKYMERFFPEVENGPYLPLGGTELEHFGSDIPLKDRPIDIVFTGNYTPPETFDKHITRIDDEYTVFYRSIIEALITNPELTMEFVFESYLKKEMPDITEEDLKICMENMIFIDLYVRFYFRGLVIRTLADSGYRVHVFGKGWDQLTCDHPENIIDGDSLDSHGCLQKIRQAKITLNVMPWFKDGSHDRVFNSMLNGALCLTDTSRYLSEELLDGVEVKFYSLKKVDQLPEIVARLLGDPDTMDRIAQAGYRKALRDHTWEERARVLEDCIEMGGRQG